MFLAILITTWILKIILAGLWKGEEYTDVAKSLKVMIALIYPIMCIFWVYVWNTWASHWIGFPQITTLKEFVVLSFFI